MTQALQSVYCVCIAPKYQGPTWHYESDLSTEVMCFFCRTVAEVVSGVLQDFRPDLVLYDAGVDPHADDKLGRLKLTDNGLMRREMQVFSRKNRTVPGSAGVASHVYTLYMDHKKGSIQDGAYLTLGEDSCLMIECSKLLTSE